MIPLFEKIADSLSASFSFLNRNNSPSNKLKADGSKNTPIIQAGNVGGNLHQTTIYGEAKNARPSLDIRNMGSSGGPDGNFFFFGVRNDGQEAARNLRAEFRNDEEVLEVMTLPNLTVNEESRQYAYRYSESRFFTGELSDPKLVVKYSSVDGRRFLSGVQLIQEARADGNYNISPRLGESFDQAL